MDGDATAIYHKCQPTFKVGLTSKVGYKKTPLVGGVLDLDDNGLFIFNLAACCFHSLLDLVCFFLWNTFLNWLWSAINDIL